MLIGRIIYVNKKARLSQCTLALPIVSYVLGLSLNYSNIKYQDYICSSFKKVTFSKSKESHHRHIKVLLTKYNERKTICILKAFLHQDCQCILRYNENFNHTVKNYLIKEKAFSRYCVSLIIQWTTKRFCNPRILLLLFVWLYISVVSFPLKQAAVCVCIYIYYGEGLRM